MANRRSLRVTGLFAGIGGIELGFHRAGHTTDLLCEVEATAQAVLQDRFPGVPLVGDVRDLDCLPDSDMVCAGFPCQDLSQAGRTAGIEGRNSGLVSEVFRLLDTRSPEWVCFENVPFMLRLERGRAMRYLTDQLSVRGYTWAYRVVDSRSFGLPQRRKRVVVLASRDSDPRPVLFADSGSRREVIDPSTVGCGFYWTEGLRGLGWAVDAVPTLKGGSTIGIPSPPAIRLPEGAGVVVPDLRDAERMQGFPVDWTLPTSEVSRRKGARWKLVGNAVSVPMAEWLGERLAAPGVWDPSMESGPVVGTWPDAAWGRNRETNAVDASHWPLAEERAPLLEFLQFEVSPLSERATAGFLQRTKRSSLRFPDRFVEDVTAHLAAVRSGRQLSFAA